MTQDFVILNMPYKIQKIYSDKVDLRYCILYELRQGKIAAESTISICFSGGI